MAIAPMTLGILVLSSLFFLSYEAGLDTKKPILTMCLNPELNEKCCIVCEAAEASKNVVFYKLQGGKGGEGACLNQDCKARNSLNSVFRNSSGTYYCIYSLDRQLHEDQWWCTDDHGESDNIILSITVHQKESTAEPTIFENSKTILVIICVGFVFIVLSIFLLANRGYRTKCKLCIGNPCSSSSNKK